MSKRTSVPSYRLHKRTGRAIVTVYDSNHARRDHLLPGPFNSNESREAYEQLLARVRTSGGVLPADKNDSKADLSIAEVMLRFMTDHVAKFHVDPDTKKPTKEQATFKQAFRPLKRLFGNVPASKFGPLNLRTVREALISGSWLNDEERAVNQKTGKLPGLARSTVNRYIDKIKFFFRWATEMELVPASVYHGLQAVAGLRRGRSEARETAPVLPVDAATVEDTLPYMPPVPADMVRVLLLSGARIGELCKLRGIDLDRSGPVWLFKPASHKTGYLGHVRTIAFGPRAQLILRQYLKADPDAILFNPAEQDRLIMAKKRAARKSKVQPSQQDRSKPNPQHKPGEQYNPMAVNNAIRRACIKANVPIWHTHQLRHSAALNILREFGAEAARSALGHRTLNLTLFYAGIDLERAKEVASKIG